MEDDANLAEPVWTRTGWRGLSPRIRRWDRYRNGVEFTFMGDLSYLSAHNAKPLPMAYEIGASCLSEMLSSQYLAPSAPIWMRMAPRRARWW
jgi:hypothetical protein